MHIPVMPAESIELLSIHPDGIYLDATAGLGGHTGLIARQLTTGAVIANDHDTRSLEMARGNTAPWGERICFHYGGVGSPGGGGGGGGVVRGGGGGGPAGGTPGVGARPGAGGLVLLHGAAG